MKRGQTNVFVVCPWVKILPAKIPLVMTRDVPFARIPRKNDFAKPQAKNLAFVFANLHSYAAALWAGCLLIS